MSRRLSALLLALAVTGLALGEEVDPPGRVARLSVIQGNVSFQAEDAKAPEEAVLNRPVTSGDRLMTESDSRAELSLGIAAIRVDERTDLSVSNLDDDIAQLEINSGAISVHLRELGSGETFEIDTPNATVRLMEPGDYRVDVLTDGVSVLAVRNGNAQIDSSTGAVNVHDQQEARLAPSDRFADVVVLGTPDEFDNWSMDRERQLQESESTRYVSREVVGYEDLDRYGTWYSEPEYGEVWAPRYVDVGWAPYTYGRWLWVGSWGWTWVDYSPWGFAPFHYGRWAYVRHRWCWVPGPRHRRPIYAPALVAWSGPRRLHGGYHSRDRRPDGWIPLGPREVYVPSHRASPRYLRNVNIGNTAIDDNTRITHAWRDRSRDQSYVNRNAPGIRPPNNGVVGDGQWRYGTGSGDSGNNHDRDGRGQNGSWRDGSQAGLTDEQRGTERWRTGPGWRTGPAQGRLVPTPGEGNDRDHRGNRDADRDRNWDQGRYQPRPGDGPIVGDGRMTNPRSPTDRRTIQQHGESQRDRIDREVALATRRYERDGSNDRTWQRRDRTNGQPDYRQPDRDRRDARPWRDGSQYRTPSQPDRGSRSYGGESRSNSGGSTYRSPPSQPRPAPQPRMEPRSSPPTSHSPGHVDRGSFRGGRSQNRQ